MAFKSNIVVALERSHASRLKRTLKYSREQYEVAKELRMSGLSLYATARAMNNGGTTTIRGGKWTATQVKSLIEKHERKN